MRHVIILFICSLSAAAQVGTFPVDTLSLTSASRQSSIVPAGSTPTLANVTVETPASGNDSIDVVVANASVVISLLTPGAAEITAANASANGYTFTTYTADGTGDGTDLLSPFLVGGTHTVIQFPTPAQPGVYKVKANASAASSDTAMTVLYYPSSSVSAEAVNQLFGIYSLTTLSAPHLGSSLADLLVAAQKMPLWELTYASHEHQRLRNW